MGKKGEKANDNRSQQEDKQYGNDNQSEKRGEKAEDNRSQKNQQYGNDRQNNQEREESPRKAAPQSNSNFQKHPHHIAVSQGEYDRRVRERDMPMKEEPALPSS